MRHPNLERIDALQSEIKRLSDDVAIPLLEEFFTLADEGKIPNRSEFARAHGVKPAWFSRRLHDDPRYNELVTKMRMWSDMEDGTFSLRDIS